MLRNKFTLNIIITLILFAFSNRLIGQNNISLFGRVIDRSGQAIPYATVVAKNKISDAIIEGTSTNEKGFFRFAVNDTSNLLIEISFLGFSTEKIDKFNVIEGRVRLGRIILKQNDKNLNEVSVQAERSTTEFKLDKRVFNVGKDLSSSGASAFEVLNNVPSVNVNIEGEITLRGSQGVQILINGKPSVLANEKGGALGTLTADLIEKVEVITNPSAKYDAEGTSGIINIVLKKEEKSGVNGSISLNTGSPHNHSLGLSMNRRKDRFNLFTQLGAGYRELPRYGEMANMNLQDSSSIQSEGIAYRNEAFYNLILGTDYKLNKHSIITLSGSYALEIEEQPSNTEFSSINKQGNIESVWNRSEETEAINPKYQYEVQYKNDIKGSEDHTLLISAIGSFFGKDQSSEFTDLTVNGVNADGEQRTEANFKESRHTFNMDYTRPFKEKFIMELGSQYVLQNVSNDYAVLNKVFSDYVIDSNFTNVFNYTQNVLGLYITGAYEGEKFGLKLGLRTENTELNTLLETTNESNNRNFTNLFPSLHSSYKLSKAFSIQAGYSRRIYRPRLWDLNPFFNYRNAFSIRTGNPDLLPQFTDSYEITSIYILKKASLNWSVYRRFTTDVIERITSFEDNVSTYLPLNIGTNSANGIEFNAKWRPSKKLSFRGDFNFNQFSRKGSYEGTNFDFNGHRWQTKWTANIKLPKNIRLEITGRYNSSFKTLQGYQSDILSSDMGMRKKFNKGRAVLSLNIRDVFASRIRETIAEQPNFYIYSKSYRGRFTTISFSYGFGKGEAMEYSGKRRRF